MKLAIPIWQGRISPVFDVAGQLLLVELIDGKEVGREEHHLQPAFPEERTQMLVKLGVEVLICGAVSHPLEAMLADSGICVIACICGDTDDVLAAFLTGRLAEERFAMPGCCRQRRQRHRGGCRRRGPPGK